MSTLKTPKGTVLPLLKLKGKDYLQVAHRIQWFNEDCEDKPFHVVTEILKSEKDESIVKATVTVFDKESGRANKLVTATKREDSKGFPDHLEKAETGAIGRALALCGYGTQFAIADLDEGTRLADSPVVNPKELPQQESVELPAAVSVSPITAESTAKRSRFAPKAKAPLTPVADTEADWGV